MSVSAVRLSLELVKTTQMGVMFAARDDFFAPLAWAEERECVFPRLVCRFVLDFTSHDNFA